MKGLKNNGSHLIDLIFYFFGSNIINGSINVTNSLIDYDSDDETLSFTFKIKHHYDQILINFIGLDEKKYSIIEIDIMTTLSRISIKDFGNNIIYENVGEDKLFKGYKKHTNKIKKYTNLSNYGNFLVEHIYKIYYENLDNDSNLNNERKISQFIDLVKSFKNEE